MISNNFSKSNCPNFQNEYELFQKQKRKLRYTSFLMKIQTTVDAYRGKPFGKEKTVMEHPQPLFLKPRTKNNNTWA